MGKAILRKVVVDVREFMSTLPAVLHQQGLDITPTTLEVLPSDIDISIPLIEHHQ